MKIQFKFHANGEIIDGDDSRFVEFKSDGTIVQSYFGGQLLPEEYEYKRTENGLYQDIRKDLPDYKDKQNTYSNTHVWLWKQRIVVSTGNGYSGSANEIELNESDYAAVLAWCDLYHPEK